jgi:hypothetical protein
MRVHGEVNKYGKYWYGTSLCGIVADLKVLADNTTNFSTSTDNSLGYPLETLFTYDIMI